MADNLPTVISGRNGTLALVLTFIIPSIVKLLNRKEAIGCAGEPGTTRK